MHPEAKDWIDQAAADIAKAMRSRKAGSAAAALIQFAMACPHGPPRACECCASACDCDADIMSMPETDKHYVLRWLHEHHAEYDAYWHAKLREIGAMAFIRRAIERDIATETTECGNPPTLGGPPTSCEGRCSCNNYGKCILKSTGRALLMHFLIDKPSPEWVTA